MGRNHETDHNHSLCRFGVSMEEELLGPFDRLIARKGYTTRSEALRDMVRDALVEETLVDETAEAIATISLVYNHHVRNLTAKLTEFQHQALAIIVSTTHIHIDTERCLEVLIVRGPYRQVRKLADHLISIKGVEHGKFVTSLGRARRGRRNSTKQNDNPVHVQRHSHD